MPPVHLPAYIPSYIQYKVYYVCFYNNVIEEVIIFYTRTLLSINIYKIYIYILYIKYNIIYRGARHQCPPQAWREKNIYFFYYGRMDKKEIYILRYISLLRNAFFFSVSCISKPNKSSPLYLLNLIYVVLKRHIYSIVRKKVHHIFLRQLECAKKSTMMMMRKSK